MLGIDLKMLQGIDTVYSYGTTGGFGIGIYYRRDGHSAPIIRGNLYCSGSPETEQLRGFHEAWNDSPEAGEPGTIRSGLNQIAVRVITQGLKPEMIATRSDKLLRIFLFGMFLSGTAVYGQSAEVPEAPLSHADSHLSPRNETPSRSIAQYKGVIKDLELAYGAYHNELSETLMGLGLALYTQGNYAAAAAALQRSLHINRVNQGLHDLSQIPILQMLIRTNKALQDWSSLDQNYNYLYWLNRRTYGEKDPRQLEFIYEMAQWHLEAFQDRLDDAPFQHILTAHSLFRKAVEIIETNRGQNNPELITPLHASVVTLYEIARYVSTDFENDQPGFTPGSNGRVMAVLTEESYPLYKLVGDSFREGKKILEQVIEIYSANPEIPIDGQALAYIYLGDWYLLFNKNDKALDTYQQAYTVVAEKGAVLDSLEQLLAEPRSLPALSLPTGNHTGQDEGQNYIVASFDVSETGRAINVEIIESKPVDDITMRTQAKRDIRASRFRPRFEKGQPVATTDVNLRYVFR